MTAPDDETQGIANHLIAFFEKEVAEERLPKNLGPLQAGIGSIANAVLTGLKDSNFEDLDHVLRSTARLYFRID